MKIVLFAYQNWGVKAIEAIMKSHHKLLHVYTHPPDLDKNEKIWFQSVKETCDVNKTPVSEIARLDNDVIDKIKTLSPEIIISSGWRKLIPRSVFEIPKNGAINMHEGLLPRYRGFAPTNWSVINGETETGLTVHYIDDSADTGDIILQKRVSINLEDSAFDVYNKTLDLSTSLLLESLELIESNKVAPINQKNLEKGFFCSRRFPRDGKINWTLDRMSVYNLIRALSDPYPNAFCLCEGKKIFIKKATLSSIDYRGPPGRICVIRDDELVVTCGTDHTKNQALLIKEIATEEGKCSITDFFKKLWIDLE